MKKRGTVLTVIADNSGASMLFVLAVMLLLMAVGTSVLVASGANISADLDKQRNNQLNIYADSMHKAIMHSLSSGASDVGKYVCGVPDPLYPDYEPATLGGQIIRELYLPFALLDEGGESSASDTFSVFADDGVTSEDLTGIFTDITIDMEAAVTVTPYVAEVPEQIEDIPDEFGVPQPTVVAPGVPEQLRSAALNGTVTVTVTAEVGGKSIISVVTYSFTDVLLEGIAGGGDDMLIQEPGDWRFISREKLDT